MPAVSSPVLVFPFVPMGPSADGAAFLQEHLAGVCEVRTWSWKPPAQRKASVGTLHQAVLREFQEFLQDLPGGFFVLADGLSGLFFLEALVLFRGEVGGMIWTNPRLDFPKAAGLGILRFAPWILSLIQGRPTFARKSKASFPLSHQASFAQFSDTLSSTARRKNKRIYAFSDQVLWLRMLRYFSKPENLQKNSFPVLLLSGDLSAKQNRLVAEQLNRDLPNSELIRFAHLKAPLFLGAEPGLIAHFAKEFILENNVTQRGPRFPLLSRSKSGRITLR